MSAKGHIKQLEAVQEAIANIGAYTAGVDVDGFVENKMLQDAMLRQYTLMSEAVHHMPQTVKNAHPEVPWKVLDKLHEMLLNEDFQADARLVWNSVIHDLPELSMQVEEMR